MRVGRLAASPSRCGRVEMAQIGDRLRRALGGDDMVWPSGVAPDMRHGQQFAATAGTRATSVPVGCRCRLRRVALAERRASRSPSGRTGSAALARMANSTQRRESAPAAASLGGQSTSDARPSTTAPARVMRFWVSVPVLSTHSTVAAPSVSTAGTRRVSTRCCEMRQAPERQEDRQDHRELLGQHRHRQRDAGQQPLPASRAPPQAVRAPRPARTATRPTSASRRTSRRGLALQRRRVRAPALASALPILPSSVRGAGGAAPRRCPGPCTTSVPEKTKGRSSPPGPVERGGAVADARLAHRHRLAGQQRLVGARGRSRRDAAASAGTRSPSASTRRSPRTTSRPAMRRCAPSRITSARGLDRSRSASSARSVLRSWTT